MEKWQPWPYLIDLIWIILKFKLTYVLKASQLGISWLLAIINLWIANYNETAKCLLLSQGQREAEDLLSKVSFIHDHLPDYIKRESDKDNREYFSLKGNKAEVRALPSKEKAGHGFQGSLVTRDEVARHEEARENWTAVARSGAKIVELSTANKNDPTNYFQEVTQTFWKNPLTVKHVLESGIEYYTNENNPTTCLVFLKWDLRPERDDYQTLEEWWNNEVVPKFTPLQIEEQYPSCIEDVFKASITKGYFEHSQLDNMGAAACTPIKQDELDTYNGLIRVYKTPIAGRKYCLYTDPSNGVGDPFVSVCGDSVTREIVCSATGMEKVSYVAKIHDYIARAYSATNSFEANAVGITMDKCLQELETPYQAPRYKADGTQDPELRGIYMEGKMKHEILFPELEYAVAHSQLMCHDIEFIDQAKHVTRDGDKAVTDKKLPFDWVMAMGGCVMLMNRAPKQSASIKTVSLSR